MTEYWVSQGNKWCDFCKIFISNNPSTIRNHELGQRHKDNVAKRLADMRKEKAAKEKEEKEAALALQQIEAKANRSYQKDIANLNDTRHSHAPPSDDQQKWEYEKTSGYYYNESNGFYYDSKSGFYYSDSIGKWVTKEEAYAMPQFSSGSDHKKTNVRLPPSTSGGTVKGDNNTSKVHSGPAPGPVVSASLNPMRSVKGNPSTLAVGKRKRQDEKPKDISKEEAAALKAREAAKKRVEEREKAFLGLYGSR